MHPAELSKNSDGKHYRLSTFIKSINNVNQKENFNRISIMTRRKRVTEEIMEKVFSYITSGKNHLLKSDAKSKVLSMMTINWKQTLTYSALLCYH